MNTDATPHAEDSTVGSVQDSTDTISADTAPMSFGVFKPVGHVMVGVPSQGQAGALEAALQAAGWQADTVQHFTPRESVAELEAMVDNAGAMAGFGYEITLLRRYLALTKEGYRWLLVKVTDSEHATAAAEVARRHGATLAIHYRTFTVDELI